MKSFQFRKLLIIALFMLNTLSLGVTVHFVEEADWPPFTPEKYGYTTEGLSYALVNEIFSRIDLDVDLELYPQKRMLKTLKEGTKDAATVISINSERSEYIEFSDPIFQKRGLVFYRNDREVPLEWTTYEDFKGLVIGVVRGHNYGDEFNDAVKEYGLKIEEVSTVEQNFKKLIMGRIDLFMAVELTAIQYLRNPEYSEKIIAADKPYYTKDYHIGFSKKSKAIKFLPEVNNVIKKMKKDGSLQDIIAPFLQ